MITACVVAAGLLAPVAEAAAQEPSLHFSRLGARDGLSQASVMAIAQDSLGFVWVGTQDGLNRFDGYDFKVFRNDPGDPSSLANAYINDLEVGPDGVLWVATFGGLHRYVAETGVFVRHVRDDADPGSIPGDVVRDVHIDADGTVWLATSQGVASLSPGSDRFVRYAETTEPDFDIRAIVSDGSGRVWFGTPSGLSELDPATGDVTEAVGGDGRPLLPTGTFVWHLYRDRSGTIWVGTGDRGLIGLAPADGTVQSYQTRAGDSASIPGDEVRAVFEDAAGTLWVGTMTGLASREVGSEGFQRHRHDPLDPRSISQNAIWAIDQSREGILWFGTAISGLSQHDPLTRRFAHYRSDPATGRGLSHDVVYGILGDGRGTIWLGTREGGLNRWDRETGTITAYRHRPGDPSSLSADYVNALAFAPDGSLWAGTYDSGLNRLDPATGRVTRYLHDPEDPGSLAMDRIRTIVADEQGLVWVGLSGGGLDRFDPATGRFTHFRADSADPSSLSGDFVRGLLIDRDGVLWVGTYGTGANRFDPSTGGFVRYRHDPADPSSLSSDFVRSVFHDSRGRHWFATDVGLNLLLDPELGTFRRYGVADGLPNPVVYGLLEDDDGRLWMSTNEGLARFDPDTESFATYTVMDGLQENEFNTGAFFRDPEGAMYFGGVAGLTVFEPGEMASDGFVPPVVVTDFLLFNEPVDVSDSGVLSVQPPLTTSIALDRNDRVLTFDFAALGYRQPARTAYEYRLDGLHDGWLRATADNRRATFTSLAPGEYTFRVRAANSSGVWSEEGASVSLTVLPAFWETLWFRAGLVLLLVGAILGAMAARQRALKHRNALLERRVEERLAHIKRLEGLLPICSSCKKIRTTDRGEREGWVPIESYISRRTDADFSHGICPDCADTLMAEADR